MNRDIRIDILRSFAIVLIILAHVSPPTIVMELRVFDVPLMVSLLGMSFVLSFNKEKNISYFSYVLKRFKRLVVPAWIFLTVFFLIILIYSFLIKESFPYDKTIILSSYGLFSGIGYVWIIRVFFVIAIVSPVLIILSKKITAMYMKIIFLAVLMLSQQLLCYLTDLFTGKFRMLFEQIVAISFGYIIIALIGMWAVKQTKKENLLLGIIFFVLFILLGVENNFELLNNQKYPPTIYFLSYGIGISMLLIYLLSNPKIQEFFNCRITVYLSKHSLEIYYWHIIPVTFLEWTNPNMFWLFKYIIVLTITLGFTFFQGKYIPYFFNVNLKKNKTNIYFRK